MHKDPFACTAIAGSTAPDCNYELPLALYHSHFGQQITGSHLLLHEFIRLLDSAMYRKAIHHVAMTLSHRSARAAGVTSRHVTRSGEAWQLRSSGASQLPYYVTMKEINGCFASA